MYDPWTSIDELIESLALIREVRMVTLPLFVRAMEIRPGMPLESRIFESSEIRSRVPFHYEYVFHDERVQMFRDIMIQVLTAPLELYSLLIETRSEITGSDGLFSELEMGLSEKIALTAHDLAIQIRNGYNSDHLLKELIQSIDLITNEYINKLSIIKAVEEGIEL